MAETVAFDIDDVLLLQAEGVCNAINIRTGTSLTVAQYTDRWDHMLGVTVEEAEELRLELIANGLFEALEAVPGAKEGLASLAEKGLRLAAITKRRESLRDVTRASLELHYGDLFGHILHATYFEGGQKFTRKKSELCLQAGATTLVDDQVSTCLEIASAGLTALHFGSYGWEELDEPHPGIVRVRNFDEVVGYFNGRN